MEAIDPDAFDKQEIEFEKEILLEQKKKEEVAMK